jgi:hypothetical protein
MMFIIQIGCDGPALTDAEGDETVSDYRRRNEVARILQAAAVLIGAHGEEQGDLTDIFGGHAGTFVFTEDD